MVAACPLPARRGTPLRIERLAEALARRGHDIHLVTYPVAGVDAKLALPVHRPFRRCRIKSLPPGPSFRRLVLYDPALALTLRPLLARGGFDLVHAHHVEGMLATGTFARRVGLPLIFDAHTSLDSELPTFCPGGFARPARWLGGWLDGLVARRADHVIAVTSDLRSVLITRRDVAPERISVIGNGVELERFAPRGADAPNRPVRIVYSGTLASYQNIDLLLRVFARARELRPELRLLLSVSTSFAPYEALAREVGVADGIDLVADDFALLPARLASAAVAVLPRVQCEGIPQKLLNYMAAGQAIVASAGSAKLIEHERSGLVVPNHDVEAFACALVRLIEEPALAQALGREAHAYVRRHCSWDAAAERCEQVYGRLAGQTELAAVDAEAPL